MRSSINFKWGSHGRLDIFWDHAGPFLSIDINIINSMMVNFKLIVLIWNLLFCYEFLCFLAIFSGSGFLLLVLFLNIFHLNGDD